MKHDLLIELDKELKIPLNRQIYESIRKAIIAGALKEGDPIPPTRSLAKQLEVSRSVILQAYELLQAEGYLEMRKGAGTFVADLSLDRSYPELEQGYPFVVSGPAFSELLVSPSIEEGRQNPIICDFRHGVPAWDAFPMDRWQKCIMKACRLASPDTLGYGPVEGSLALRQEIARLVRSTRSIPVSPEQIVITSGATQALDILSRLCLSSGSKVVVEDPSHNVIREIFKFSGAEVIPVRVDAEGICVHEIEGIEGSGSATRLVYVTPSHQFPLGVTLSLKRRIQLLEWARVNNTFIIEDDYDSEYRYVGPKLSALAGLDASGRVIYVGSFSKILFPALRIGYVILPVTLVQDFLAVKWITDRMSPSLDQEALAEFIRSGQYAQHVAQMGKLYATRRTSLVNSLNHEFGDRIRYYGEEAGLHVLIELKSNANEEQLAKALLQQGVRIYPASAYFSNCKPKGPVFLLGYGNLSESQIQIGVRRLAEVEAEINNT